MKTGTYKSNGKAPLPTPKPLKIGLTGGIGAGKSAVLALLRQRGTPVLQTDEVARRLLESPAIHKRIVGRFGKGVLGRDGKIERSQLAALAFSNPRNQQALNRILHPAVRQEVSRWIQKQKKGTAVGRVVVVEVPLLFERGYYHFFDGVLSVSASNPVRHKRLLKRGWEWPEIRRRDRLQWPQARKNKMADWVMTNNGNKSDLKRKVGEWLNQLNCGNFG